MTLTWNDIPISVLLDSGAQRNLLSTQFAAKQSLTLIDKEPTDIFQLSMADGRLAGVSDSSTIGILRDHDTFEEKFCMDVAPIRYDVILGKPWFTEFNPTIDWTTNHVSFQANEHLISWTAVPFDHYDKMTVSPKQLDKLLSRPHAAAFAVWIDRPYQDAHEEIEASNMAVKDLDPRVASLLHEFPQVFPTDLPRRLPPSRPVDHRIRLLPGVSPHSQAPYRLSHVEKQEMHRVIQDLLKLGHIRPSHSPWSAPVLFVKKKDGSLRFCVDYRMLNKRSVRNMFPMPRTDELLDRIQGSKIFSKLDLRSAYSQVRVHPEDIDKTAFTTPFGHYEYLVLPFGLSNGPATFQTLMNRLLGHLDFVIVYLDDILIFSENEHEHFDHIRQVLKILADNSLYAKWEKCSFCKPVMDFLGHVVSAKGIAVDPDKIKAIVSWPTPESVKDIQRFLGLANYYRRFCRSFARIASPITDLLRKDTPFVWDAPQQQAFASLKELLTSTPVLRSPDPTAPFRVETDSSGFAIGAVLLQKHGRHWHPVAYLSRKMNQAERSYPIQEQELLALVYALKKWRHYLFGHPVQAYTDHESLTHWQKYRNITGRKARWVALLDEFPVEILYRPGSSNIVADTLSRRPDHQANALSVTQGPNWQARIAEGYKNDDLFQLLVAHFRNPEAPVPAEIISIIPRYHYDDNSKLLYFMTSHQPRLCIPREPDLIPELLHELHALPISGHTGCEKLYVSARQSYYWPKMQKSIQNFIQHCDACQRNKPNNRSTKGPLKPLDVPSTPWSSVSFDFITGLPPSSGFDSIFVVVDRFTKMAHFTPNHSTDEAPDIASLYVNHIFRLHGLPRSFVSDRDPKFTSGFWRGLFDLLRTKLSFSSTAHPESDGQTERINGILEVMIRHFVSANLDDWSHLLPYLEFAYNNAPQKSTGYSPFYLNYGFSPRTPIAMTLDPIPESKNEAVSSYVDHMQSLWNSAQDAIHEAQTSQAYYANLHRDLNRTFQVGDDVLLSTKGLKVKFLARNSHKLQPLYIGPFKITQKLSPVSYRLQLPPTLGIHDVIYISKLRSYHAPATPANSREHILLEDSGTRLYIVDALLRSRSPRGRPTEYLVKWKDFPEHESTWEPRSILMEDVPELVHDFESRQ